MTENKFLRYGDHIYLQSGEGSKCYLAARSVLEEKVYFVETPAPSLEYPNEEADSTFYENQTELVFAIYPKLSYQAIKNYMKLKTNEDQFKTELLEKRLTVEEDQNEKLVEKMTGVPVTFGSEVQLYHISSKCFVRTTREKNIRRHDLFNLKLSKRGGSGMYFKITPYLHFKREGERISLKDLFFLENTKLQASIVYKNLPEYPPSDSHEKDDESIVHDAVTPHNRNPPNGSLNLPCVPLLELTSTFTKYEAGLQQGSNLPLTAKPVYLRNSQTIPSLTGSNKPILWGDYIRLKYMVDSRTAGYFYCDHTIVGDTPYVYFRTIGAPSQHEKDSFQGIFQLVPDNEDKYGTPIKFSDENNKRSIPIRLRHMLTGRYFTIGQPESKCSLSDTLDEYLAKQELIQLDPLPFAEDLENPASYTSLNRDPSVVSEAAKKLTKLAQTKSNPQMHHMKSGPVKNFENQSINSFGNLLEKMRPRQVSEVSKHKSVLEKMRSEQQQTSLNILPPPASDVLTENINLLNVPPNITYLQEQIEVIQGPLTKFQEATKIVIKNASQDDEEYLSTGSVFSIGSQFAYLSVKLFNKGDRTEREAFKWMNTASRNHEGLNRFFQPRFHKRNPLEKEEFEAIYSRQSDKYFHFSLVSPNEISEVLAIHSRLYPLIKILQETKKGYEEYPMDGSRNLQRSKKRHSLQNKKTVESPAERRQNSLFHALEACRKLNIWLEGTEELLDTGELDRKVKQKMFREFGVIDILFYILSQFFVKNLLKAESRDLIMYKPLTQAIVALLSSIIYQNKVNNIYVFQWSQLQQEMTLSPTIANDLGVDKLLSQIFYENVIDISELKAIPNYLDFRNYDLKALNIAIALYQYNPIRSIKDRDQIITTLIVNVENRNKIFRRFIKDPLGDIIVENVDHEKSLRIDTSLEYRDKKIFDYTLGIVNLATEIAKSKPQVVSKYLSEYFSQQLCTDIFEDKKWNHLFRSGFLELFTEMYFAVSKAQLPEMSFPNDLKLLANVRTPEAIVNLFENRKALVMRQVSLGHFRIKQFVQDFLDDSHKWADDEHNYVQSVFKLIHLMCKHGLYDLDELRRLKQSLYQYLKVGLAVILDDIAPKTRVHTSKTLGGIKRLASVHSPHQRRQTLSSSSFKKDKKKDAQKRPTPDPKEAKEESKILDKSLGDLKGAVYEALPEEEDNADRSEPYWRKTEINEMTSWMQEILQILIFIEYYESDNKKKEFFENERSLRFFNERLLNRTGTNEIFSSLLLSKMKKDKRDYILRYMNDNFASQNYNHTLLLMEMLLIDNLALTQPLVQLLYLNFSSYKQFLTGINNSHIIYSANVDLYGHFVKIHDSFKYFKVELDSLHGRQVTTKSSDIYVAVDLTLTELLNILFDKNKPVKTSNEPNSNIFQVYGDYMFESISGFEKQKLLLKVGFFGIMAELFIPLVEGSFMIDEAKREKFLTNFLYFYIYFCFRNPENQKIVAESASFLEQVLKIELQNLQPLLLRFVSAIYRDNYSLLIHVSQARPNIIQMLLKMFFAKFSIEDIGKNAFFIHCMRIFSTFFQIRGNFLSNNQILFADSFHSIVINNKDSYDINHFFYVKLFGFLSQFKIDDFLIFEGSDTVKIPLEISFAIYFLNTFAMMAAGKTSSNSNACLKNKYYLSIKEISWLIKKAGDWFNLKLALVTYLINVYIKNKKLEDNEVSELYDIMRECMLEEIGEYNRFLKNRHLYSRPPEQKFIESFKKYYPIPTEFKYSENIDDCYHQYIVYGVIDAFLAYGQRIKDEASENDHAILDDYVSSSLKELHELWRSGIFQKNNAQTDLSTIYLKHKMIAPLDEPTDPEINEGDLYNPQKNERKKIKQLKRDMVILSNSIKSVEKAVALKVINIEKYGGTFSGKSTSDFMAIDPQTIEEKHGNELEVLIKFLLELKVENPGKFRMIIRSFMNVLASEEVPAVIKQSTLKILRKLSNFKEDPDIYEAIQGDFVQLNIIDFFDDIIINAKTEDDRLEFIMGMIDFLDDASPKIQQELYEVLIKDEENRLLETLAKFILTNFEEFRENEKNYNEQSEDIQRNAKGVVYKKMYAVIQSLELLRLACENHYEAMQNYLREQIQNGAKCKRSINFINLIAEIFNRYTKSVNERNAKLGVQILDTLIEMLQGPCQENQIALCNTKILENLEDLTVEVKNIRSKKEGLIWIEMNKKTIILIQAILEGSYNSYIVKQVSIHVNVSFFLERMLEAFEKTSKEKTRVVSSQQKAIQGTKMTDVMTLDFLEGQLANADHYHSAEVGYNALLDEGIELAIILNFLADTSQDIKLKMSNFKDKLSEEEIERFRSFQKAEVFYNRYIGQIEIVNKKGDLQRIYFPVVKKTKYLSSVTKTKFLDEVKRESANEKLFGLLRYQKIFLDEMDHFVSLREKSFKFSLTHFSRLRTINLILALITNLFIIFSPPTVTYDLNGSSGLNGVIKGLGIAHIIISSLILIFWSIFKAPLDLRAASKNYILEHQTDSLNMEKADETDFSSFTKRLDNWRLKASYMIFHTYMVYLVMGVIFSFLGTFYSVVFFAFLLLDIVDRSVILNNVIKSVTLNYKQLLMTFLLGILLLYIYAAIGFYSVFRNQYDPDDPTDFEYYCSTIWQCFLSLTNQALTTGNGVGGPFKEIPYHEEGYVARYFFDLFYFLMILIILLNIIFGIIIDTFAELRDQKQLKGIDFYCDLFF